MQSYRLEDLMGTWLSQFPMSHMPNLPFISAPELAPKEDLLVQAGLSGAPQQLPLRNNFNMIIIYRRTISPPQFSYCRQCCHFANPLDSSKFLVAFLMPFSRPSFVSHMFSLSL